MNPRHWWNYRVVRTASSTDAFYQIHEVHYENKEDGTQEITLWSLPISSGGESPEELLRDLQHMIDALNKPCLEEKNGKLVEIADPCP